MDKNWKIGETGSQYRGRLYGEMRKELAEHKRALIAALEAKGHKVKPLDDEDLEDQRRQTWTVDGDDVEVDGGIDSKGGFFGTPTGTCRFAIGPYDDRKRFRQHTNAAFLKKHPAGFDYDEVADEVLAVIDREKKRERAAEVQAEKEGRAEAKYRAAYDRLTKEFGLKANFGQSYPFDYPSRGQETITLKLRDLTEGQARAILAAARDCGALKEEDGE